MLLTTIYFDLMTIFVPKPLRLWHVNTYIVNLANFTLKLSNIIHLFDPIIRSMGQTLIFDQNSPIKIIIWCSQLANKNSIAFTSNFKTLESPSF